MSMEKGHHQCPSPIESYLPTRISTLHPSAWMLISAGLSCAIIIVDNAANTMTMSIANPLFLNRFIWTTSFRGKGSLCPNRGYFFRCFNHVESILVSITTEIKLFGPHDCIYANAVITALFYNGPPIARELDFLFFYLFKCTHTCLPFCSVLRHELDN